MGLYGHRGSALNLPKLFREGNGYVQRQRWFEVIWYEKGYGAGRTPSDLPPRYPYTASTWYCCSLQLLPPGWKKVEERRVLAVCHFTISIKQPSIDLADGKQSRGSEPTELHSLLVVW